jgi:putative transposase
MIVRKLKLKPTKEQKQLFQQWLLHLSSIYNWGLRKIELNAKDKIYFSQKTFQNLLPGYSDKLNISSHTIQGTLIQVHTAWQRCFKKLARKPRLKGFRNKLNSIPFPDPIKKIQLKSVKLPGIGKIHFHKQELPHGKIKCARIVKRPSGWYLCLWIDTIHTFYVKDTDKAVGIDPGFTTLLTLSDGTKIENPRELRKGAHRLAQAQRGQRKHLAARTHERQCNRRNDRNHKISRWLIENHKTIYYCNDNFRGMARRFGKSVSEAALGNLTGMITYKGNNCGRRVVPVKSARTTMTCSVCSALTGPAGLSGLAVRHWKCGVCGTQHDRDINSAQVVFNVGSGLGLKEHSNELN